MRKQKENVQQQAADSINESLEIGIEAQEKMEEMLQQGIDDAFEAAQSGLRQIRAAAPATDIFYGLQEKNIETARSGVKAAFSTYRRSIAQPVRKMMREQSAKLAEKVGA
ncbi:MAG: hypothetical protein COB53_01645 [Elusimicrobia bacterium]|nr:MAG: hypothetical protein COB53_01645 [Elusimicrobiota bacterium]